MSKNSIRSWIIIITLVAVVVIVLAVIYSEDPNQHHVSTQTTQVGMAQTAAIPAPITINATNQPTLGNPKAPLHIIVFEDLKCSACQHYNVTLYPQIEKDFINTGKAKYTIINLAFIPGSLPAANAAHCIYLQNHQAFFDFVKYVYHHQPPENQNWATIPTLLEFAGHVKGINQQKLTDCLVQQPYDNLFTNNILIAKKAMGDTISTPTLYVNGIHVTPLTMAQFKNVIKKVTP